MLLTSPSELRRFLNDHKIFPKKHLSQNFLIDGNIVRKLLQEAAISEKNRVIEIGAGPGAITQALISANAEVIAIEKDPQLANTLHRFPNVQVYEEDALLFPFDSLLKDKKKYKIVSNLPFQISTPILTRFVQSEDLFESITVIVQEEMARRMTAKPNTGDYCSLTCFLGFYADVRYAFPVSRNCFYPAPKVDSAVVSLYLKQPPRITSHEAFFQFVRTAFQQRRKMVKKTLGKIYGQENLKEKMHELKIPETSRPENLSLENFIDLFRKLIP